MTLLQAASPLVGLAFNCLVQVLACRRDRRLLRSVYRGFAGGAAACALACGFGEELPPALVTYAALGYCYFHFINLGETARRVRLMRELAEAGPAGLGKEELLSRYNARTMVEARFRRLLDNSQVVERNGRYYVGKPAVLWMARLVLLLKKLLLGRAGENR
ncbi:MAG: hypothetical protein A2089_11530 [Elusimicrobia bacterium GWD2_63_28]|nr:MAG: hypothetical protein A2089_11530 [Elusimicrobia bacterium GWD2_63_28]